MAKDLVATARQIRAGGNPDAAAVLLQDACTRNPRDAATSAELAKLLSELPPNEVVKLSRRHEFKFASVVGGQRAGWHNLLRPAAWLLLGTMLGFGFVLIGPSLGAIVAGICLSLAVAWNWWMKDPLTYLGSVLTYGTRPGAYNFCNAALLAFSLLVLAGGLIAAISR